MENWKDVKGYEGLYQVSNLGNVKGLDRIVKNKNGHRLVKERLVKKYIHNSYYIVNLNKKSKQKTHSVHQLVAESFLNHTRQGHTLLVDHIDNDPLNNNVCNLQLVTNRYNTRKDQSNYTSSYKGVYFNKKAKKWVARILINKKRVSLGSFDCEIHAAYQYIKAVKELV
jgi:hypothetical protein